MKRVRQQRITELLTESRSLTTLALAATLGVSQETIRRDLNELQR